MEKLIKRHIICILVSFGFPCTNELHQNWINNTTSYIFDITFLWIFFQDFLFNGITNTMFSQLGSNLRHLNIIKSRLINGYNDNGLSQYDHERICRTIHKFSMIGNFFYGGNLIALSSFLLMAYINVNLVC